MYDIQYVPREDSFRTTNKVSYQKFAKGSFGKIFFSTFKAFIFHRLQVNKPFLDLDWIIYKRGVKFSAQTYRSCLRAEAENRISFFLNPQTEKINSKVFFSFSAVLKREKNYS